MTRTVQITDLREVKALTLTCGKCGASFTLPIGRHRTPDACHNCGHALEASRIEELLTLLRCLNPSDSASWRLTFETDPER